MSISKGIGWSNTDNILYEIWKEIKKLQTIVAKTVSQESDQSGITENYYSPDFFKSGRTYLNLNITNTGTGAVTLTAGTTDGGDDLLSDEVVNPGQTGSFEINRVFPSVTPIYLSSDDWNGSIIEIKTVSL